MEAAAGDVSAGRSTTNARRCPRVRGGSHAGDRVDSPRRSERSPRAAWTRRRFPMPVSPTRSSPSISPCADVGLVWCRDDNGSRIAHLAAAGEDTRQRRCHLVFATNAGIFDLTFRPVGLHIEDGRTLVQLNTADGDGNFYLKPNGVFAILNGQARVRQRRRGCRFVRECDNGD